jgi:hypothetical protein
MVNPPRIRCAASFAGRSLAGRSLAGRLLARSLLAGSLLLAACPGPEPREPEPSPEEPIELPSPPYVSCEDYVEQGLAVTARSREDFRAALGEPERIQSEPIPNRHDPALTDTIFQLEYEGLVAGIHRPAGMDDLLERVHVRDNRYLTYPELGIGAPEDRVLSSLGPPDERTDRQLLYVCEPRFEPEEPVLFVLEDGRVVEVQFTFYVD